MNKADFDTSAPLSLPGAVVAGPVPAVPDSYGTEPLFGEAVRVRQSGAGRGRRPAPVQEECLFGLEG
ncbi:hypothetical protein [Streptomyces sp. bgisy060]|uniref:hypothetical protein n=1 Tax=Streptomyces sp. bgisy060 TaxID=3413775 RepID=UPI003EB8C09F